MQSFRYYILAAIAALMITSCDEWEALVVTEINTDGTCNRTITTSDPQCVDYDSLWEETYQSKRDGTTDSSMVSLSRTFENADAMAANPIISIYGEKVKSQVSLDKHFKWFYADYNYTETFPGWQDHFEIPVTDYMHEEEASYMFTGKPDYVIKGQTGLEAVDYLDKLQESYEQWVFANVLNCDFKLIANHYDDISNPPVDKATFLSLRDSVVRFGYEKEYDAFTDVEQLLEDFFETKAYGIFFKDITPYDDEAETIFNETFGICNLKMPYILIMPGHVTDTGGGSIDTSLVKKPGKEGIVYRVEGNYLVVGDYTITASSRVTNVWAFILSGLIILLALASLLYRRK